jgi:hypothetical protein
MNQENIKQKEENENKEKEKNTLRKMKFIFNAIENGWKVKKRGKSYVFSKPHENKKEIFSDTYLRQFIETTFTTFTTF